MCIYFKQKIVVIHLVNVYRHTCPANKFSCRSISHGKFPSDDSPTRNAESFALAHKRRPMRRSRRRRQPTSSIPKHSHAHTHTLTHVMVRTRTALPTRSQRSGQISLISTVEHIGRSTKRTCVSLVVLFLVFTRTLFSRTHTHTKPLSAEVCMNRRRRRRRHSNISRPTNCPRESRICASMCVCVCVYACVCPASQHKYKKKTLPPLAAPPINQPKLFHIEGKTISRPRLFKTPLLHPTTHSQTLA